MYNIVCVCLDGCIEKEGKKEKKTKRKKKKALRVSSCINRMFAISEANASTSVSVTKTTLIERKNNGLTNVKCLLLFFFYIANLFVLPLLLLLFFIFILLLFVWLLKH